MSFKIDHLAIGKELALKDIFFVFDKTEIRSESYPKLDSIAEVIKASQWWIFSFSRTYR